MTATVGMSLRLSPEEHAALAKLIPRGQYNEWIRLIIRAELIRQGTLKPEKGKR